ncbi:hypothetical protein IQ268_01165 [Oculatella sp. LEGE 06141]|nr:hypothetical protein [Oculatella sp. LEGE 06141]MBE9177184.1 hypothetical protein [Oculatella sp. LEGE 06141]
MSASKQSQEWHSLLATRGGDRYAGIRKEIIRFVLISVYTEVMDQGI